jgi:hypothetical protein
LVHVSANSVRDATEQLGAVLLAEQAGELASAPPVRPSATPLPTRLYITMDGVLAHLHERSWSEIKVGCCYQTRTRPERKRPEQLEIRAHSTSYTTALAEAHTFGWYLWQEAVRRGVLTADEVVVLGDGAHWIWNVAETHFPRATQILDWYHASEYVWAAASAIWGEVGEQRVGWAHQQLELLWDGKVNEVLAELEPWRERGEAVEAALSYYTTHQTRMDYASYRARGLQIGSGSVESACKQVVSARLKQAGMIWNAAGAEAVAMVRAWLKSARWEEAIALRPFVRRGYQRQQGAVEAGVGVVRAQEQPASAARSGEVPREGAGSGRIPAELLAQVRAELVQERANHPWRRAWSARRQHEQALQREVGGTTIPA